MEILLIDIGALAVFVGFLAIAYWQGISRKAQPLKRRFK
jgi:hypothetical protein